MKLGGHVGNLPDGSVEVSATGPRNDLQRLLARLESGPPGSVIRSVEARWSKAPPARPGQRFEIRTS
jgi:acylphosphatase